MSFDIINFRQEIRQHYSDAEKKPLPSQTITENDVSSDHSHVDHNSEPVAQKPISPALVMGWARIIDAVLIALAGYLSFLFHVEPQSGISHKLYLLLIVFMAPLAILVLQTYRSYAMHALSLARKQIVKLWFGLTTAFIIIISTTYILGVFTEISRFWFLFFYVTSFTSLLLFRVLFALTIKYWFKTGRLTKNVVIVGGGQMGRDVIASIENSKDSSFKVVGVFDDRDKERLGTNAVNYPILGTVAELVNFARIHRVDMLIVAIPLRAEQRLQDIFNQLWVLPIDIRLSAQSKALHHNAPSLSYVGQAPVIDIYDKPMSDWDTLIKSIFDKVIALIAFVLLSPVMILTALAVKLESKGPALFKQKRYGFNNELVEVFKFRSMYTDMSDADAAKLVTKEDPRVTKVGRFIRKTSLDELPQLFNVLRGDLSLVGPRPHAVQAKAADRLYNDVVDGYFARHKVKPGITGWAQINGWRGETDTDEKIQKRVDYDIEYIEKWSLLLDMYILAATPMSLLNTKNAY